MNPPAKNTLSSTPLTPSLSRRGFITRASALVGATLSGQTLAQNLWDRSMKDSLSSLKSQFPHLTAVEARYDAKARERRQIIDSIMDRQNGIGLRLHPHLPQFITSLSTTLGFDPGMTARLIRHESKWDPRAVSHKGAQGMMQMMPIAAEDLETRVRGSKWEPYYLQYFKKISSNTISYLGDRELQKTLRLLQSPQTSFSEARKLIRQIGHSFFEPQANMISGMVYLSGIREQIQGRSDLRTRSEDIVKSFTPQEHAKIMLSRQAIGASRFGYMDRLALAQNLRSEQSLAETFELLAQYNGGTRPPRESYWYATVIQFA